MISSNCYQNWSLKKFFRVELCTPINPVALFQDVQWNLSLAEILYDENVYIVDIISRNKRYTNMDHFLIIRTSIERTAIYTGH